MLRFLFAGVVTVGGLVLLFIASFGDPASMLRDVPTSLRTIANALPGSSPAEPPKVPVAVPVVTAGSNAGTPATTTPATPRSPEETALIQQRAALQQQVQGLQTSVSQARQDVAGLQAEAERQRKALEDLRQKRETGDQAAISPPQISPQVITSTSSSQNVKSQPANLSPKSMAAQNHASPDAWESVLSRLRHDATLVHPPADSARTVASQSRLKDARTALATGRVDDARRLLEQVQVQLALRPVTPSQDDPGPPTVASGQVAEALSMLNAGDVGDAVRYIDLALDQIRNAQSVATAPQFSYEQPAAAASGYDRTSAGFFGN